MALSSKPTILPPTGPVRLDDLANAVASAPALLGVRDSLVVKTVLVDPGDGTWVHFATTMLVGGDDQLPEGEVVQTPFPQARLVAVRLAATDVEGRFDLEAYLTSWKAGLPSVPSDFQDPNYVYRERSRNRWTPLPCWWLNLYEKLGSRNAQTPHGPFYHPDTRFYAPTFGDMASRWLGDENCRGATNVSNAYTVVVPDARAYLGALKADGNDLQVTVTGHDPGPLFCGYQMRDFDGRLHSDSAPVENGQALIRFPRAVRALHLDLLDANGIQRDSYEENERQASWGRSLFNEDRLSSDPIFADLRHAVEVGEGQRIEFKPWIALKPRDAKSREFVETAVAFANAEGGVLYVGVSDGAEVTGVEPALRKTYGARHGGDFGRMRDSYAVDLRRILAESVMPPISPGLDWVTHGGLLVLRITVPRGEDQPHYLLETNEFFVRKGATNRRAQREELRQMFMKEGY